MNSQHFVVESKAHGGASDQPNSVLNSLSVEHIFPNFLMTGNAPTISLGERGVIIGHLFSRKTLTQRITDLSPVEMLRILSSSGKALFDEFWGGYVAVIADEDGTLNVLRDPSGIMPCYWRMRENTYVVSNDIENVACWRGPAMVDYSLTAQYLASIGYSGDRTGLEDTFELAAGSALVIQGGKSSILNLWSPWKFIRQAETLTIEEAADELHSVVSGCVRAWASCFENIILGVSGGLDSTIVGVATAPYTRLRCMNMHADDPDGDERHYARILTEQLGLELEFGHFSLKEIDVAQAVTPHRPWPNISFFASCIQRKHEIMNAHDPASAYFSGNGGDNIFCSLRSTSPFLDRLLSEGPGLGLKKTLRDLCRLTETDAPTVLKAAWLQYLKSRKGTVAKRDATGLAAASGLSAVLRHPWMDRPDTTLPGKIGHVGLLASAQQSHELYPRSSAPPHIAPLLSQPIVELCLAIPTWLWIDDGMNRAVARRAFEQELPERLLRRSSKGGPGAFVQEIFRNRQSEVKSILRNGLLAKHGFLDLGYLDAPDDPSWRGSSRSQRLLQFAAAENWCRFWDGRQSQSASSRNR